MKKICFPIIAIAFIAMTLPAMAQVIIGGEFKAGTTLATNDGNTASKAEAKLVFTANADDNAAALVELKWKEDISFTKEPGTFIDKGYITIKALEALGFKDLPVSIQLQAGYYEWDNKNFAKVTAYEVEDVIDFKDKDFNFGIDIAITNLITLHADIQPDWGFNEKTTGSGGLLPFTVGAYGAFLDKMISAELFYTNTEKANSGIEGANGDIGLGIGFAKDIIEGLNLKVGANLDAALYEDPQLFYGFGVAAAYQKLAKLGVGLMGTYDTASGADNKKVLNSIGINAEFTPIPVITLFAGSLLALFEGNNSTLGTLEAGVKFNLGKACVSTGWLFIPEGAASVSALNAKDDLYSWKQPDSSTEEAINAFFINTYLKF